MAEPSRGNHPTAEDAAASGGRSDRDVAAMRAASLTALIAATSLSCGGSSPWTELDSINDLKAVFQGDSGKARIVLLLSPT
jgi:hypothetical protein